MTRPRTTRTDESSQRPRVAVMTGSRSEYGLLRGLIEEIHGSPALELQLIVAGMHLIAELGDTRATVAAEFPISAEVPMAPTADTRVGMAEGVADGLRRFTRTLSELSPDLLVVLGDRTEAFAAATAAGYLEIPVAQLHGGDVSGNPIDDFQRDAIARVATLHFPATETSAARLGQLGVTGTTTISGAPGLDEIFARTPAARDVVAAQCGLDAAAPWVAFVYHPNPAHDDFHNATEAAAALAGTLDWCDEIEGQLAVIYPNNDAGHQSVIDAIEKVRNHPRVRIFQSLERDRFLDLLHHATLLVGNSSCGLIESVAAGVAVLNVGDRQQGRERDANVLDVPADAAAIRYGAAQLATDKEIAAKVAATLTERRSVYGDGRAAVNIAAALHRFFGVAPSSPKAKDTSVECI
ncbi:MAG: UDP-N-acetylglucosamine 2-epimerase [Planctomycetota bacterium]